jgi:protein O-mannosyl-transferase
MAPDKPATPSGQDKTTSNARPNDPSRGKGAAGDAPSESRRHRGADLAGIGLVAAVAIVAMAPTLRGTFLPGDDGHFIVNHSIVSRPGLFGALRLFTIVHRDLYQPVPMLSFMLDSAAYGDHAWGFHLTNVLWHALATVLVWLLVRVSWQHWWLATVAAVLFAAHPQAVEPVGTVTGRIVQMGVAFSLAAVVAFLLWSQHEHGEGGWLAAAVLCTLLAMMSKVQIALPILLLMVVYGQRKRTARAWWSAWGVLSALTVGFVLLAWWTTSRTGVVSAATTQLPGPAVGRALMAMGMYVVHIVWPANLSPWYLPPSPWSWSAPLIWTGLVGLIVLAGASVICYRRKLHVAAAGFAWYLVVIVPMLGASVARNLIAADRYTYLANVGICLVAAVAVVGVADRCRRSGSSARIAGLGLVVGGVVAALLVTSWRHAVHYRTGLSFYERVAAVCPDGQWVHLNVGWELARAGRLDEAERAARAEIENPKGDPTRANQLLAWIAEKRGDWDQAERHYAASLKALPNDAEAHYRFALLLEKRGRLGQSIAEYQRALDAHAGHLGALLGLARLHERAGRFDKAAAALESALRISPDHRDALFRMGTVRLHQGNLDDAERYLLRAIEVAPRHVQARTNLAAVLAQTGRDKEALAHYDQILAERPGLISARLNRAELFKRWGHNARAGEDYRTILSYDPTCVPALEGMEEILYKMVPKDASQRAVRMWTTAVKHGGARPDLLARLAMAQAAAGQLADAEQTANKCLASDRDNALSRLSLVVVALNRKQTDLAIELLERVCAGRDDPATTIALDRAARIIGLYGLRHRNEPLPYFLLGRILLRRNDLPMAKQTFGELVRVTEDAVWRDRVRQLLTDGRVQPRKSATTSSGTSGPSR